MNYLSHTDLTDLTDYFIAFGDSAIEQLLVAWPEAISVRSVRSV